MHTWEGRFKTLLRIFYILLTCTAFWCYKSPALLDYLVKDIPHISITVLLVVYGFIYFWMSTIQKRVVSFETARAKLKAQLKDTEKLLIDRMDPTLYTTLKEIVKKDMKSELELLRKNDLGCTDKCRTKNRLLEVNLERHEEIVKTLISFKWCEECTAVDTGAVKVVCKGACGQRLMKA